MLENIKSIFFIKELFLSYISEKRRMDIIKYNKGLQNQLKLTIFEYKLFSGKYIIYEENGKGKEYLMKDDEFIFKGEYLDGKRNGQGREYEYSQLIFIGEYLYGKRNGKGKEYFCDKLKFEGEYANGKRNGKGKEYNFMNGEIIFEGEYLNGKRNGKGKEYEDHQLIFEGEYLNRNRLIGEKYDINNNIIYGKEYNNNMLVYEGEYLNGKRNGEGKEYNYNGFIKYEGQYKNGLKNGKGKEYDDKYCNLIFEGDYLNGIKYNGIIYDYENINNEYEIKDGKGFIREYDNSGELKYEGEYFNGKSHGKGKEYGNNELPFPLSSC